jgi:hypothetical protein
LVAQTATKPPRVKKRSCTVVGGIPDCSICVDFTEFNDQIKTNFQGTPVCLNVNMAVGNMGKISFGLCSDPTSHFDVTNGIFSPKSMPGKCTRIRHREINIINCPVSVGLAYSCICPFGTAQPPATCVSTGTDCISCDDGQPPQGPTNGQSCNSPPQSCQVDNLNWARTDTIQCWPIDAGFDTNTHTDWNTKGSQVPIQEVPTGFRFNDARIALSKPPMTTVSFGNDQYTTLPDEMFTGTSLVRINVAACPNLASLDAEFLKGIDVTTLQVMWITDNTNLADGIHPQIFDTTFGAWHLTNLAIARCGLTMVKSQWFAGITRLNTLYLNVNEITALDDNVFNGLTQMRYMYFNDNKIASVSAALFSNMLSLRVIDLKYNLLTSVPSSTFTTGNHDLLEIYLSGNTCGPETNCGRLQLGSTWPVITCECL